MPGCQTIAKSYFLKVCVSVYSRLGLVLRILPENSAAAPKTDQHSTNTKKKKKKSKSRQSSIPLKHQGHLKRVLEEKNIKMGCFTSLGKLHKKYNLHEGRDHVLFPVLCPLYHCTHSDSARHTAERTISDERGLYIQLHAVPKLRHGLWSSGTSSGSVPHRDLRRGSHILLHPLLITKCL